MGKIELKDMRFFAHHGCYEEERKHGRWFEVDLIFDINAKQAMLSDNINDTINYATVFSLVKQTMAEPVNLIEHIAYRIARAVSEAYPNAENLIVTVKKMSPPVDGEISYVSFTYNTTKGL